MLLIRAAAAIDVPLLLRFFRELAEYERQPNAVVVKEKTLISGWSWLFPSHANMLAAASSETVRAPLLELRNRSRTAANAPGVSPI